jgi:stage II sporulation protein M
MVKEKSLLFVLCGLLPHGVLEIPAFIIGEAAAISFGTMLLAALFNKERRPDVLPQLRVELKYLMVALALLVPAALVETYVTPLLLT